MLAPITPGVLQADGFAGFLTIGQLHRSGCLEVPDAPGIYVVLMRDEAPHGFMRCSSAPVWRRQDPSVAESVLTAKWVEGAGLLYVGRASGPGVRSRLRQRLKRFLRFGHGSVVAHWSGRFIWQMREPSRLVLAWRVCDEGEDPARLGADLLSRFEQQYGVLPFANLPDETPGDENETAAG
jgi:hypothetical protein